MIPSLEGLPTNAKEAPSPHEVRLSPLDTNPVFHSLGGNLVFTDSACGSSVNNEERIQKFKETGHSQNIYRNKLDKACFQHDTAYGNFEDLPRRTASDKILHDKSFKNPNNDGYQKGLA